MADDEERKLLKKIKEVFDKYDIEKEGLMQTFEVVNALSSLKISTTQSDVDATLTDLNITDGTITPEQFSEVIAKLEERAQKAELCDAFRCFDKDNKGYITYDQLEEILKPMLGNEITKEELRDIVEQADSDSSGTIEIEEFVDFLSQ